MKLLPFRSNSALVDTKRTARHNKAWYVNPILQNLI
ncbi:hypothetical protein ACJIZ3_006250 [Penstemon smallii]|uniref:Uncharacterized protein n=1 Tax=Penstemon smallii TaxID=265156 RepID=A0ABD3S7G5_9LAMI